MNAFALMLAIAGTACAAAWIASLISGDTSWVDRLWSLLPEAYVWVCAGYAHFHDAPLDVVTALTTAWGLRLTFNFARKGGYSGVEDYRWAVLRAQMSAVQFQLFNLFFIVLYQNFLLVLIALPAYEVLEHPRAFGLVDLVLAVLFALALAGETVADEQQWRFHLRKAAAARDGREVEPGFLTTGLFRFSRHPNYFFEQAQWWLVYCFGAYADRHLIAGWSLAGPVLLTILFIGSTRFTESLSATKYPGYARYQRTTSAQIPWWPRSRRGFPEGERALAGPGEERPLS